MIEAAKTYDRRNEFEHRNQVEGELALKYDKRQNLIVPFGKTLNFAGTTGKLVTLGLNVSDEFTISIDGAAAFALASGSSVTTLQTEVTNARSGEANLLARLTIINTTAVDAGTAAATAQSEVTAAREGETSLLAKVNVMESATASAASAAATAQTEISAARDGEASLLAKINSIDSAIVDGDAAVASSVTTLTATVNAKNQTFVQTSAPTAIAAGDLWIDSDDNNKLYRATAAGSGSWVAVPYTDTGKVTTFAQNDAPTALAVGDLWIDTNDSNKVYRATAVGSGSWSAVDDARIAVNATAIAAVDGKLSASYGVTVDAGGRIASLKLLSDGTTSTIAFTASTLKIFDDSSTDVAPFEVSGGVVRIKNANIGAGNVTASNISVSTLSALAADIGTATAGTIRNSGDTFNIDVTNGRIRFTAGSYVLYEGNGFGVSSDLVMWYGLASVAIGSTTKTNGVWAFATDGVVYYGATALDSGGASAVTSYYDDGGWYLDNSTHTLVASVSVPSVAANDKIEWELNESASSPVWTGTDPQGGFEIIEYNGSSENVLYTGTWGPATAGGGDPQLVLGATSGGLTGRSYTGTVTYRLKTWKTAGVALDSGFFTGHLRVVRSP